MSLDFIPARLCFAVLVRDQPPGIVACYCEEEQFRAESWISDIRTFLEHHESPMFVLAQYLRERELGTSRIGYARELETELPSAVLVDADLILDSARAIKSWEEQDLLIQSANVTEDAILSTFLSVQPWGFREWDGRRLGHASSPGWSQFLLAYLGH